MIYFFSRGWGSSGIRVFLIGLLRFFLLFWFCLMSFWMYLGAFAFLIVGVFCFGIRVVSGPIACFVLVFFIWRFVLLRLLWVLIFSFLLFFSTCVDSDPTSVCVCYSPWGFDPVSSLIFAFVLRFVWNRAP